MQPWSPGVWKPMFLTLGKIDIDAITPRMILEAIAPYWFEVEGEL